MPRSLRRARGHAGDGSIGFTAQSVSFRPGNKKSEARATMLSGVTFGEYRPEMSNAEFRARRRQLIEQGRFDLVQQLDGRQKQVRATHLELVARQDVQRAAKTEQKRARRESKRRIGREKALHELRKKARIITAATDDRGVIIDRARWESIDQMTIAELSRIVCESKRHKLAAKMSRRQRERMILAEVDRLDRVVSEMAQEP